MEEPENTIPPLVRILQFHEIFNSYAKYLTCLTHMLCESSYFLLVETNERAKGNATFTVIILLLFLP